MTIAKNIIKYYKHITIALTVEEKQTQNKGNRIKC